MTLQTTKTKQKQHYTTNNNDKQQTIHYQHKQHTYNKQPTTKHNKTLPPTKCNRQHTTNNTLQTTNYELRISINNNKQNDTR